MRKTITVKWLTEIGSCIEAREAFTAQKERRTEKILNLLLQQNKVDWCNWLLTRLMTHKQQVKYAIYAANQVIDLYEVKYPDNKRPRRAIRAAQNYVNHPCAQTAYAANAAANAAYAAAYAANAANAANAAYAAAYAANAAANAAYAAYAAANAANAAANAAYAAAYAANAAYAAYAVYAAANAAYAAMKLKIIRYGIKLLRKP